MNDDLPPGWSSTILKNLVVSRKGKKPAVLREYSGDGFLPYLDIRAIEKKEVRQFADVKSSNLASRNDLLVVWDGARSGWVGTGVSGAIGSTIMALTAREANPIYLKTFISSKFSTINTNTKGTGIPHVDPEIFWNIEVPIAPLPEQRRIVAKLEKLLDKVDTCQKRLAKIPILLKRFRQSVLAAACSGRLTADWRQDGVSENDLPNGWKYVKVHEIFPTGGIFDGPFGSNLKSSDYTDSGVRVIRLEIIGHLRFIDEKVTYIGEHKYETLKRHSVGKGDIIFSSFIGDEIRACILPKLSTPAIAKADCFCLRPKPELVNRQFLIFQLVTRDSFDWLFENIHGATRPRINTTQLKKLEIKICPIPEQQEIVNRVQTLFEIADQIESRYSKVKAQVDKLTQSILAKAFRGELAPQNPNDEPAGMLLERIRAMHSQDGAGQAANGRNKAPAGATPRRRPKPRRKRVARS